jgi:ABC-type multidrug transport system fused ATPase/permease subunit
VRSGETIGIAGPSGVGKTTLLNLAARFYDPTRGAVRFDGTDLRRFRLADVYEKLAIVTQEPFLFATTVRDNIRVGRPDATDAEVEAAAKAAEMHDDIIGFVDGSDTAVGIGARPLSTGQAQRVNIARALLKNAPILLLDEATSSLDSLSEAKVQSAIDRLMEGRTTFVVAHRLSTLRSADRILVLDDGRCVGLGPHEALIATCPLYARMWETQQMGGATARRVLSVDDHDDVVVDWEVP